MRLLLYTLCKVDMGIRGFFFLTSKIFSWSCSPKETSGSNNLKNMETRSLSRVHDSIRRCLQLAFNIKSHIVLYRLYPRFASTANLKHFAGLGQGVVGVTRAPKVGPGNRPLIPGWLELIIGQRHLFVTT